MKILFFFLLLNYYYWNRNISFLQKLFGIILNFFNFLEYLILFVFQVNCIYILLLYKFLMKEYYMNFNRKKYNFKFYKHRYRYNEKKKKSIYISKIYDLYYRRKMYFGLTIVYMQIFKRQLKEKKNDIIYMYFYKWKRNYNYYKKKIINYSLLFFFYNNYNLAVYFYKLKKKLFNFFFIIRFIKMYTIFLLLNRIIKIINYFNYYLTKFKILLNLKN
jgi:hypothetical protein